MRDRRRIRRQQNLSGISLDQDSGRMLNIAVAIPIAKDRSDNDGDPTPKLHASL